MSAGTDPTAGGSVISLPSGGGALGGLGEKFSPDLFTGTGNFSVPIALPQGRNGLAPQLSLSYSTGAGNGPFGLGWALSLPGVSRKTSRGVPRYREDDTFVLSGAEDLVPVAGSNTYRPRTEGLFARIEHVADDFWEVRGKDGLRTRYGTLRPAGADAGWRDPAALASPNGAVFAWKITETVDLLGNVVRYSYLRDRGGESDDPGHAWDQPLVARIDYADYGDRADPRFLVGVEFEYELRPDRFSDYRAGFEIRSTRRCRTIRITTHAGDGVDRVAREYRFTYEQAPFNGASMLTRVDVVGIDGAAEEQLPPLTFGYAVFDPARRRFRSVTGPGLPELADRSVTLVDLRGSGLPDVVELGATQRYWSNRGEGRFELPRPIVEAPPHSLGDPGVRLLDADGDGRPDLVVAAAGQAGYFPMTFAGGWSRRSFQPYAAAPSVGLDDPSVRLVDLDGDGLTDVLRSGSRLDCWFNDPDPRHAWRPGVGDGPNVDLADPHVRLADMTGDGLQDIVLLRSGNIAYWPNLGHGRFGPKVQMRRSPRLPDGHDPRRLLLGDVDGDGVADLVYVDRGRVLLWGNQTGNGWTPEPVTITGTPDVVDTDSVQLSDLHGTGMAGVLWSSVANGSGSSLRFLDLTGGVKPYLLDAMDNHLGARTTVEYRPSTTYFLTDQADPATRWRTTLPFPVHVVARVEVTDAHSQGRLVTEYRYHHGYWDGVEREFRGFAMVEQFDTETFHGGDVHYSPPTLIRSWFHPGPVAAAEAGDWAELDLSHEYWPDDPAQLYRPPEMLEGLSRPARRDALRALRGQMLRTELYALDGTDRADRPYTVTEGVCGVRVVAPRVYFPFAMAGRTTQWERGIDPMTQYTFTAGHDEFGFATQKLAVAVPRGRDPLAAAATAEPYLATYTTTEYARRDGLYLADRVARTTTHEVINDGRRDVLALRDAVLAGTAQVRVIGHSRTYYDGEPHVGLPLRRLGEHGLPVRSESLAFPDSFLDELFHPADPRAISPRPPYLNPATVSWGTEYPDQFRTLLPNLAGYRHYTDSDEPGSPGGYYITDTRHRYDVHDPHRVARGRLLSSLDPFDAESHIGYDEEHQLLPVRTTDPAGLITEAAYDLRVLQPADVTDINDNTRSVTFSPAGFVTAQFVRGKYGEGDTHRPSTTMTYDLLAFAERGEPVSVRAARRVQHDGDELIESVEYSDGFGRLLQTRAQAEDTLFGDETFGDGVIPAEPGNPTPTTTGRTRPDNVVVSGGQIYDNKGRVVEKYEPFFARGFAYAPPLDAQLGQKARIFYDPRGRVIRTVNPDGSEQLVVLGVPADLAHPEVFAPTAWETFTYDANDNAGRTHAATATAYQDHWNTPASIVVDPLGRTVAATARNGAEKITTRSTYDIQGNLVAITDALGREDAFAYRYDLAKRRWRMDSRDAGRHDTVPDAAGNPVESRDAKGALTLGASDRLRRPIRLWARDGTGRPLTLRQRIEYGDAGDPDQPAGDRAAARAHNLLGVAIAAYDEAGLVTVTDVDFKANVLDTARRVIADAPLLAAYQQAAANGWQVTPFAVDWDADDPLEPTEYRTTTSYDALNRVTRQVLPTDVQGHRGEIVPRYNRAGGLEQVRLDDTVYVQRIAYDAKGQRTLIAYGNGVLTRYAYQPRTFRLARMRTERYTLDGPTYRPNGSAMQDCGYVYDLVGNILAVRDRTPRSGILNTAAGVDALDRTFAYDPIYRLISATGRECDLPPDLPWEDRPRGVDPTRTRAYTENYTYDRMGSLLRLRHGTCSAGFVRTFAVETGSNRLTWMRVCGTRYDYRFDNAGNMIAETTSRHFTWNHADQLIAFATQTAGAEPSVHAQYLYDATGARVKKLVRRQGGAVEVTHYLGGFEHHRWGTPSNPTANNHIHVGDDQQRIALVRRGPAHPDDRGPATQYHLGDHLTNSNVVVDDTGAQTRREEYTPYGETSFGSYTRKRFRFTGQERDGESGLSQQGLRYLASGIARWCSCDPVGAGAGVNLFTYAFDNPIRFIDPSGTEPTSAGLDDTTRAEMAGLGFTLDETGSFYEDPGAGEKVEITGTGTSDPLGSCVAAGNCRAISSRADITSDVLAVYKSNRTLDAQTYNVLSESDPEGAQAMLDKEVDRKYSRLVADAEAKMSKNDRVMGGALPFLVVAAIISATGALGAVPTTAAGLAPGTVVKGAFGGLNATILGLQLFDMTLAGEGLIAELLGIPRSGSGDETGTPVAAGAVIGGPADISTIPGVEGYQTDMTTTRFDGRTLHVHLTATAHGGGAGQQINSAAVDAFVDYYTAVAAARGAIALRVTGTLTGANHVVSIAPVVLIRTGVNVLPSPRFRFPIRIR